MRTSERRANGASVIALLGDDWYLDSAAAENTDPWLEDPQPLAVFMENSMGIPLWPVQRQDLEAFLGSTVEDTKRLFTQEPPTPYNCGALVYGKGCLGPDEHLTDAATGKTRTVSEWAQLKVPLLLPSWNGSEVVLRVTSPVYRKGRSPLYRVTLKDGRSFTATSEHQCLSPEGWLPLKNFRVGHTRLLTTPQKGLYTSRIDVSFHIEILDIQELGESSYYDLTVPGTHCYFDSQGICHHNSGKDLIASAMLAWFVHILFCLRSPKEFLGLEPSEAIDIALASPTLRQTRRITFTKLKNRLRGWGWLKNRLRDLGVANPSKYLKKATDAADYIELPHDIRIHNIPLIAASSEGFNTIAFILSEFAAMESDATAETADEVLNSFMSSGKTRFRKAWKGFLASFPRSLNDPQEKIVEQHENGLFPELFVVRRATWDVHPGRTFEDFATDFERDPEGSWAKYGAQPRAATESYFRSPELIVKHASGGDLTLFQRTFKNRTPAQHQWLCDRLPDPIAARDLIGDVALNEYGFPRLSEWFWGQSGREYWAHIDIGLSRDSTGVAIGHLEDTGTGFLPVLDLTFRWKASHFAEFGDIRRYSWRYDRETQQFTSGQEYTENIQAAEIDLKTVTDFMLWLKAARGFHFEGVSCDGFNSAQLMQTLLQFDIPVNLHTVDKEDYDELKGAIYTRQLQYWCDRALFHELSKLEIRNGKVDAPRTKTDSGSQKTDSHKDEADAAARVAAVLCKLVAVQTDFVQLPDVDEELDSEPEPESRAIAAGDYSEVQQRLLDEFLS
ncbi:MAG: hypothetical protein F6K42_18075 [Leptolyngbya sp. SIO1D8]|nr:hypothetical protein [Leptolyngbya sp. SIO1D8]